ncbi:MAG: aldehyde ferredoxin oxidoreductase N-terminal domain-containing protein, partial [Candidatus Hodarchaeota archaeon]
MTKEKISIENREESFYRRYIGGEGFVAYFLLKESKPGADPFGPENKLIFAAGPLTGTSVAGSGRNSVGAKSPLTGGFGEAEVGGHWGAELKHAGFDAIVVEGRAENPVYLWVNDREAEIREADHLWGRDTGDTQRILIEELNDKRVQVAQIGLGGERLVRYACIMNGSHDAAGRTGMGAVMGSKKLKAVAVRGHGKIKVADAEKLKELTEWLLGNPEIWAWAHDFGTGGDTMEAYVSLG